MEYNRCKVCKAGDGRCGPTIDGECLNCKETRETQEATVHLCYPRTEEEIARMMERLLVVKKPEMTWGLRVS